MQKTKQVTRGISNRSLEIKKTILAFPVPTLARPRMFEIFNIRTCAFFLMSTIICEVYSRIDANYGAFPLRDQREWCSLVLTYRAAWKKANEIMVTFEMWRFGKST